MGAYLVGLNGTTFKPRETLTKCTLDINLKMPPTCGLLTSDMEASPTAMPSSARAWCTRLRKASLTATPSVETVFSCYG